MVYNDNYPLGEGADNLNSLIEPMRAKKKKSQIQCPQCKGFKTRSISTRTRLATGAAALIIIGCFFCMLIIGLIIGIPLIGIGILMLISCIFIKDNGQTLCDTCGFKFDKNALNQDQVVPS